jgi:hypothetical protein
MCELFVAPIRHSLSRFPLFFVAVFPYLFGGLSPLSSLPNDALSFLTFCSHTPLSPCPPCSSPSMSLTHPLLLALAIGSVSGTHPHPGPVHSHFLPCPLPSLSLSPGDSHAMSLGQ